MWLQVGDTIVNLNKVGQITKEDNFIIVYGLNFDDKLTIYKFNDEKECDKYYFKLRTILAKKSSLGVLV